MKTFFTAKRICRAGIIAALYLALTIAFGSLSFQGFLQIRPAEALTLLPLLFPEAVPALFIGCALANLTSPFFLYDVLLGSSVTLLAALCTYFCGRLLKKDSLKIVLGGLFPVVLNALCIPLIIVFLCGGAGGSPVWTAYFAFAASIFLTEAVWVYALGAPMYMLLRKIKK